ncbi:MAG: NUDIX pyrophosphatase [Clostridia bacterium]|nr:NUDIX pyrophosphatase [Clostridia bacterium]
MRLPYQTLIILYKLVDGEPLFCVFHRATPDIWQFVSGGGEEGEQPAETARRELWEETGIKADHLLPLTSQAFVPAAFIGPYHRQGWPVPTYVIPEHAFAFEADADTQPVLSEEHTEYAWLPFTEAKAVLRFDSNRVAMYELLCRIKGETMHWDV